MCATTQARSSLRTGVKPIRVELGSRRCPRMGEPLRLGRNKLHFNSPQVERRHAAIEARFYPQMLKMYADEEDEMNF